jgi:ADP-heptose:LPS heptosyltransferase
MSTLFLVGSGIGNQVQTIPAFYVAKRNFGDLTVVNMEPYNIEATNVLFHGLAPVLSRDDVDTSKYDRQISTYFCNGRFGELSCVLDRYPKPSESEFEYNMLAAGQGNIEMVDVGDCLAYIEPVKAPQVIIHNGYNKKGIDIPDKWKAKSYAHWVEVSDLLRKDGYTVGSIGSSDEYIDGTEDLTGLPLKDSIAVMKGCRVVLSNDTSSYHLCNLIATQNVVVFTMTDRVKNYDARFHRYSLMLASEVLCSPCQAMGKMYWYIMKDKCKWRCREDIKPSTIVREAISRI